MIGAAKGRIGKLTYTPHLYQKKAIKFLLGNAAAALFLDPG